MKRLVSTLLALVLLNMLYGQTDSVMAGEDFFQAIGKMYVVVAIILVIFAGVSLYLWRLDRKLSQLEKKSQNE
ncbi:MAG: CcmD family protein [Saprospiraceae bacterium]|nr:CcmD family protein [Saprospiraceae bacterium]